MNYRREIDGLRAIAVVPVVLFHAGFSVFGGGFVGVDVFFVISGYLITGLILTELEAGTFTLARFYERRARRILPALFLVMLCCLPFAWLWMMPSQLLAFAKSLVGVTLFSSNIVFWMQSTYFEVQALEKPLWHTWSLGIEEQYYLLFPVFVALFARFGRKGLARIIALAAVASFVLMFVIGSSARFYLAPPRAWELLAGALIAVWRRDRPISTPVSEWGAALGGAAIAYSVFAFTRDTPFPGVFTLVPVLGTALVITCATPATVVGKLLCQPAFVGIGLVSYSFYLWHQPLFAFARIRSETAPSANALGLLGLVALGLAYVSWRFVERPFRDRRRGSARQVLAAAVSGSLLFLVAAAAVFATKGGLYRFPAADHDLVTIGPAERGVYLASRFRSLASDFSGSSAKRILVLGDSFAEDFINMVHENAALTSYEIRTFPTNGSCQVLTPSDPYVDCRDFDLRTDPVFQRRLMAADVLIVGFDWSEEPAKNLTRTIAALGMRPEQRLFVLSTKRLAAVKPLTYLPLTLEERVALRKPPVEHVPANDALRAEFPASVYIDMNDAICGPAGFCPVFTPDGRLISYDAFHLTKEGARFTGSLVLAKTPLRELSR